MFQNQITTYDFNRFLTYPVAYTNRNPVKVANVAALLKTMASKLTKNAPLLEATRFSNNPISKFKEYQTYHKKLERIHMQIEAKCRTKYAAIKLLSVPNWRKKGSKMVEEDFAEQVLQIMTVLSSFDEKYQVKDAKISPVLKNFLICQFYSSVYELAGKKLLCAANAISGRKNIKDIGEAINVLASPHHLYFKKHFDNKLRNAIFHQNYIVDESKTPPLMQYTNIRSDKKKTVIGRLKTTDLEEVYKKTVFILMFLIASLHIGALKHSEAYQEALTKAGF